MLQRIFALSPNRVEMWAMAHPLRLQILGALVEGPSTASRLGRRIGESSGSVSYHLRVLAKAGAIVEETELGTRRERWWRRQEPVFVVLPTQDDLESRAIAARMHGIVFARDEEARRQFVTREIGPGWREAAVVGNWIVELSPEEAQELGERLLAIVREARLRKPSGKADRALVSLSILPWLDVRH
jgi:DNA-binding transcriptional ArsR family regulator